MIANNTMIGSGSAIGTGHGARCYNNLEYLTSAGLSVGNGGTVADHDYNVMYFPPPSSSNFLMIYNTWGDRYYTMSGWRAATGWDTHSHLSKPAIDTLTGIPAGNDTVARGQGKNLSAYFTTDFYGNPRPATGAWTIGAFENGPSPIVERGSWKAPPLSQRTTYPNPVDIRGLSAVLGPRSADIIICDTAGKRIAVSEIKHNGIYLFQTPNTGTFQKIAVIGQ